jgi:hypothetical protein
MVTTYKVKSLTSSGCLVEPPNCGPHYNLYSPFSSSFESEESALAAIHECLKSEHRFAYENLVVVQVYNPNYLEE